jgi:hypothetical protein
MDKFQFDATPTWRPVIAGQEPQGRVILSLLSNGRPVRQTRVVIGEFITRFDVEIEDGGEYCDEDGAEYLPQGWYADSLIGNEYWLIDNGEWEIIGWQPLPYSVAVTPDK